MDCSRITKQIIDFQRHAFNNTFTMMVLFQDQVEKAGNIMIEQASWFPEETKAWAGDWKAALKKSRDGYKKLADDTFQHIEAHFAQI